MSEGFGTLLWWAFGLLCYFVELCYTLGDLWIVVAHAENRYETNKFFIRTNGLCCSSLVGVGDPIQVNHENDGKCRYLPGLRDPKWWTCSVFCSEGLKPRGSNYNISPLVCAWSFMMCSFHFINGWSNIVFESQYESHSSSFIGK